MVFVIQRNISTSLVDLVSRLIVTELQSLRVTAQNRNLKLNDVKSHCNVFIFLNNGNVWFLGIKFFFFFPYSLVRKFSINAQFSRNPGRLAQKSAETFCLAKIFSPRKLGKKACIFQSERIETIMMV